MLGAPRSGTTWLGKIFDSHPHVLYRHEPDLAVPNTSIPMLCPAEEEPLYLAETRRWLADMVATRNLKAVGKLPMFAKAGDSKLSRFARSSLVVALHACATCLSRSQRHRLNVPQWFDRMPIGQSRHVVIKSVSSSGRVGLLATALPQARIIVIVRNPPAQIASRLVGYEAGHFSRFKLTEGLLRGHATERYGLTEARLRSLSMVEQMAWEWVILSDNAVAAAAASPDATVIRFRDLVQNPQHHARALLDFAGLPWDARVERFIAASTRYQGRDQYFQIRKNSQAPLSKWRKTLSAADRAAILAVVAHSSVARQRFPETFE